MYVEFSLEISGLVLSPNKWLNNMPIRMYVVLRSVDPRQAKNLLD